MRRPLSEFLNQDLNISQSLLQKCQCFKVFFNLFIFFLFLIVFLIDEYICHLNYSFFITVKAQMPFTIFLLAHLETLAK